MSVKTALQMKTMFQHKKEQSNIKVSPLRVVSLYWPNFSR